MKIFVVTHKKTNLNITNPYYFIQVGCALAHEKFPSMSYDDTGDNISSKNPFFCELTALYWIWKNIQDTDILGLVHYRRFFVGNQAFHLGDRIIKVISEKEISNLLSSHDIILPRKRHYYVESVRSQYGNAHDANDLKIIEEIISRLCPDYLNAFNEIMNSKSLSLYNMMIIKKQDFDNYCEWLFSILFEAEKIIDWENRNTYEKRVFGFIAERLLNVWVTKNKLTVAPVKVICTEKQGLTKYIKFLTRFISHGKYGKR